MTQYTSPSPASFFSFSRSVVFGSKDASSRLAEASSVPDFEYSVASVLMLSLFSLPFRGNLGKGVWEKGRRLRIEDGKGREISERKDCRAVRRKIEVGNIFGTFCLDFLCWGRRVTRIQQVVVLACWNESNSELSLNMQKVYLTYSARIEKLRAILGKPSFHEVQGWNC